MSSTTRNESVIHNPARRRRKSKETDPLTMSIILLGKDVSTNCRVGNFMLGRSAFDSEAPPDDHQIERVRGKDMMIINCPHLLQLNLSYHQIIQTVRECVDLSHPGPHLILLIFKHDECSREDQERLEIILNYFSDSVYQHTLVLTTHDSHSEEQTDVNDIIKEIIKKCLNKHYRLERNSSPGELKKKCEDIVRLNDGRYLICDEFIDSQSFIVKQQTDERVLEDVKLNLVLCGSDRRLKSSILKLMMKESSRRSVMRSDFMRREMKVCGRLINLMELPDLSRLSEDKVMRQTISCLSLCDPGVHVFLIIVPDGPLTDGDKEEMQAIHRIFDSGKHFVVIFTSEFTVDRSVADTQTFSTETQSLISLCGGRHRVLKLKEDEKSRQIPDLLDYIEDIKTEPYSLQMYVRAQEKRWRHEIEEKYKENLKRLENKIKQLQQKIQSYGAEGEAEDLEFLRIVLIGRTGSGKSATGNTILGQNQFLSKLSSDSVTTVCEKRVCEIGGHSVAVVDTPGLFEATMSNEKIQEEIVKCVSMAAPGPHAFIIVLSLGRFTREESDTIDLMKKIFGPNAAQFSLVLFTRRDDLEDESIEDYVKSSKSGELKKLIRDCGNRYLAFNNREKQDRTQVTKLINMIEEMKTTNHGKYFTNSMFEEAEMSIKKRMEEILKEKEREIQAEKDEIKAKYKIEMENITKRLEKEKQIVEEERLKMEKKFREKEEILRKEFEEKEKTAQQKRDEEKQKRLEEEKQQRDKYHQKIEKMKREIEQQRLQYETREKEREEKYSQDQEKMKYEHKQIIAELQKKQEEEIKKRDLDEQKRSEQEERERKEWVRKIREAENDRKETQEEIKRQQREWEEEKKRQMREREEEQRKRKQTHEEQLREKREELEKMRKKFEKEREEERQKIEEERQKREREQKRKENEQIKNEMMKHYEKMNQERKQEWERRKQEDDERREEERKRWREINEVIKMEKEEEIRRREIMAKKQKEINQDHERKIKEIKQKHEYEARKHEEEFNEFRERKERHVKELEEKLEEREKQHKLLEKVHQDYKTQRDEEIRQLQTELVMVKNKSECVIQ